MLKRFTTWSTSADPILALGVVVATACAVWALVAAWAWPLVGDEALMHYVVLMLRAGAAPYSQLVDINLPGSYGLDALTMRCLGEGARGLRLYDGLLCSVTLVGSVALTERSWRARLCGALAGLLFILIHLRDGLVQSGQRDLAMAAAVVTAFVVCNKWRPAQGRAAALLYGLLIGATLTIKPTLAPLLLLPLVEAVLHGKGFSSGLKRLAVAALGASFPVALMFWWLSCWHAVPAFVAVMTSLGVGHRELARKSLSFLLAHAVVPVAALAGVAGVLTWRLRRHLDIEDKRILFGVGCGLLSFLAQSKGFPYQRYPFLILALVFAFRMVARGLAGARLDVILSVAAIVMAGFWFAPTFARSASSYDTGTPFETALVADLKAVHAQDHEVQCLDTVGGCINTLYDLRLVQSTGYL